MGTNYYLHEDACPHCGRSDEPLYIGKSSCGWCFAVHVIPEDGINTLDDWRKLWTKPGVIIRDEYGEIFSPEDMETVITRRRRDDFDWDSDWAQRSGYSSELLFHRRNYSERGPNGMLRHRVGGHCVGHGEGTWDYVRGYFS